MSNSKVQSAERVSDSDPSDNYVFQRSLLAYHHAAGLVGGRVLEIGTGSGYGTTILSPACERFLTIDKSKPSLDFSGFENAEFRRMKVPPLGLPSNSFDWVVSFQVIEHIRDDFGFLNEVKRVLKHGGRFLVTTPNSRMSLTRNPWHVREYTAGEFTNLMECHFEDVQAFGVFGGDRVQEYYERNRQGVERISKFDPLDLQHRLPRWMLRVPYDIANRTNRRRLLSENGELTTSITMDDYHLAPVTDESFDLLYIGTKQ
jgi:SAM-dependent methyltransferase